MANHDNPQTRKRLTKLQRKFCAEYVVDMNGTQAAIRAGYAPKNAKVTASKLLTLPNIQDALKDFQKELSAELEITPKRVLKEWANIAFSNMGDYLTINEDGDPIIDLSKCSREQLAVLSETEVQDFLDARAEGVKDGDSGAKRKGRDVRRVKIKLHSKIQALDALSKHLGLFDEDNKQKGSESLNALLDWLSGRSNGSTLDNATQDQG